MASIFMIFTGVFAMAALATVLTGVFGMAQGGAFNKRYGNKLMRLRVLFQFLAIACLILFLLAR